MKTVAITLGVAAGGAAALALALGACSSDTFTPPDGGDDVAVDRNTPPDASDGGAVDAPVDAPPQSWCAANAADATACADFDGVDAATALAPTWFSSGIGNASFKVGAAPQAQPVKPANPSAPNQLGASIGPPDGGPGTITLSAGGITNASIVTLDFDFQRPSVIGTNGQAVEFAIVEVQNANPLDSVVLRLVLEQNSWQARGNITGGIVAFPSDPIGFNEWHRIRLKLEASGYAIVVDNTPVVNGGLSKPWPSNGGSYGRLGATELFTVSNAVTAWFDNVVWRTN